MSTSLLAIDEVLPRPSGGGHTTAGDGGAQLAGNEIDRSDGQENQQDQEGDLPPFQDPDLFGQIEPDPARADYAEDGGRAGVGFDEVEDLSRNDRQHLRHEPKSDLGHAPPAGRPHPFRLLRVGRFDDLRKELAERAEIRGGAMASTPAKG